MPTVAERVSRHRFPRLANQLQLPGGGSERPTLEGASGFDVCILDLELTRNAPDLLGPTGYLRTTSPNSILFAYFSAGDINITAPPFMTITREYNALFSKDWWMCDVNGQPVLLFVGDNITTYLQNQTLQAVNTFFSTFSYTHGLSTGLWDGMFCDRLENQISQVPTFFPPLTTGALSIDNTLGNLGSPTSDDDADLGWLAGMRRLLTNTRSMTMPGGALIGNVGYNWGYDFAHTIGSTSVDFSDLVNGFLIENFTEDTTPSYPRFTWSARMRSYAHFMSNCASPQICIIHATQDTPTNPSEWDFVRMRFSLCSTLMFDGYFCYTNSGIYASNWLFDEYVVNLVDDVPIYPSGKVYPSARYKGYLGLPNSTEPRAYNVANSSEFLEDVLLGSTPSDAENEVWRRDFDNGIVLVNPTANTASNINLNGTFKRILGDSSFEWSDPTFNDGATGLTQITLPSRTGIVMLND